MLIKKLGKICRIDDRLDRRDFMSKKCEETDDEILEMNYNFDDNNINSDYCINEKIPTRNKYIRKILKTNLSGFSNQKEIYIVSKKNLSRSLTRKGIPIVKQKDKLIKKVSGKISAKSKNGKYIFHKKTKNKKKLSSSKNIGKYFREKKLKVKYIDKNT